MNSMSASNKSVFGQKVNPRRGLERFLGSFLANPRGDMKQILRWSFRLIFCLLLTLAGLWLWRDHLPDSTGWIHSLKTFHLPGEVDISTRFQSYASKTSLEGKLLVVKVDRIERFTHTQQSAPLGGLFPLRPQIAEIEVPVIYNYFVNVKQPWQFRWEISPEPRAKPVLRVIPPLLTTEMPATRIAELKWRKKSSAQHMNEALLTMGAELMNRAVQGKAAVRAEADAAIAEFVQNWLRAEPADWPEALDVRVEARP